MLSRNYTQTLKFTSLHGSLKLVLVSLTLLHAFFLNFVCLARTDTHPALCVSSCFLRYVEYSYLTDTYPALCVSSCFLRYVEYSYLTDTYPALCVSSCFLRYVECSYLRSSTDIST